MALDGLGDELQLVGADPLAVIFAVLMALQQMVGALGQGASGAAAPIGLLAKMAADHGIDTCHLLEDPGTLVLKR